MGSTSAGWRIGGGLGSHRGAAPSVLVDRVMLIRQAGGRSLEDLWEVRRVTIRSHTPQANCTEVLSLDLGVYVSMTPPSEEGLYQDALGAYDYLVRTRMIRSD